MDKDATNLPIVPELLDDEDTISATMRNVTDILHATASEYIAPRSAGSGAAAGVVLGAKAGAQLLTSSHAGAVVSRRGAVHVLRAATAALTAASLVLCLCCVYHDGGILSAAALVCGRALQGAGAAGAGVGGLALAAAVARAPGEGIAPLLGAVALGVLVGYPFGGIAYKLWSRAAPFQIITVALLFNLALQCLLLDKEEFNQRSSFLSEEGAARPALTSLRCEVSACAGAVLLTTSVMAALEPCLPVWIMHKFHPQRWALGAVFIPDSLGYLLATTSAGGVARRAGAERAALVGQAAVGLAAIALPTVNSVGWLALPHLVLGLGLGLADGALVPAVLARAPRSVPQRAALLQAAASAAYALGPVIGGMAAWAVGFGNLLRALGVANLLYVAYLYCALRKHPLSKQWGAITPAEDDDSEGLHLTPIHASGVAYTTLYEDTGH